MGPQAAEPNGSLSGNDLERPGVTIGDLADHRPGERAVRLELREEQGLALRRHRNEEPTGGLCIGQHHPIRLADRGVETRR